ncbi:hypothetical protein [Paraburkholderia solisilvae]|uniref:Uncharacterized protein n=1 Tax=Paraburkholderia solisilvae TaxID=624376 RepID=A0A6J5E1W5_9BURK|nr:hypothetical protein [Paraburkholderia solisilvae]CAB3759381.1 hypothetical protein LMG29739_03139 [Paraburkholderia solisilvae]
MRIYKAVSDLPVELRILLDEIKRALDSRADADRAAIANRDAIAAGELRIAELEAASKELDARAVMAEAKAAGDISLKSDAGKAAKAADKAAADLADVRRIHERRVAAVEHLHAEARAIDETISSLKKRLQTDMRAYCNQILCAANEDLIEACSPLIPVIQAVAAVNGMMPNGGLARDWLDCAKLISPVDYRSDHLSGHVRVHGTDLLAGDGSLPDLPVGAATAIQEIVSISKALSQHKNFQLPKALQPEAPPRSAADQRRYDEQAKRIRLAEEEFDRRQERAKEPSKERGYTHRVGGSHTSRASEVNVMHASGPLADDWSQLDGGAPSKHTGRGTP